MNNSAKNTTGIVTFDREHRNRLVKDALEWKNDGGSASEFARNQKIARTTLAGWLKGCDGQRGRVKKLGPFEETEILKLLLADSDLQSWRTVMKTVRRQSGESISRRSMFRLLGKWGLVSPNTGRGRTTRVNAIPWKQPQETMLKGSNELKGVLWQIHSGRGSEGFILTSSDSSNELDQVLTAITGGLKGRNRSLLTNHPRLADLLAVALPRWNVRLED